jgi:nitrogen regulatory protein PII
MTSNPIYNTMQQNIIVAPTGSHNHDLEVEQYRAEDDRRVLQQRLREMELQLTYERVRNESVLQELRETNRNGTIGDSKISVNACIIL